MISRQDLKDRIDQLSPTAIQFVARTLDSSPRHRKQASTRRGLGSRTVPIGLSISVSHSRFTMARLPILCD